MKTYAGIDVSLEASSICIIDEAGNVVREGRAVSEPDALIAFLRAHRGPLVRVGLEAGPFSEWLHDGLVAAGFETVLLETRHLNATLSAMPTKTDRSDGRGIAQAVRTGWYRRVHSKSGHARQVRSLIGARKLTVEKRVDVAASVRGLLRAWGIKLGKVSVARFAGAVRLRIDGLAVAALIEPLLAVYEAFRKAELAYGRMVYKLAKQDPVSRLLTSAPGVGPVTALAFRAAIDDPARISRNRNLGALLGLTPRRYQSGEIDRSGAISKAGDKSLRALLYEAATALLGRSARRCWLKRWAEKLAQRRGVKRARVALARRLAVVLLAMWKTDTPYRCESAPAA